MWFQNPHTDTPGTSTRSVLITVVAGAVIAVWVLWKILSPFFHRPDPNQSHTREAGSVVVSLQPTLPGIDLEQATDLLVEAVVQIESQGNPGMVGSIGERGLMQIRESTWNQVTKRHFGQVISFDRAFEPELNRTVGRLYLGDLQQLLYSQKDKWQSDLRTLLLASYNAGPERVRKSSYNVKRLPEKVQSYARRGSALHDWYLKQDAKTLHKIMNSQVE